MARIKGTKNKQTLIREAEEEAIRAGLSPKERLDTLYVMEHIMEYFFFRAKGMRAVNNHERAEHYYLNALAAAEKIAPYRYARLKAITLAGDPNAPNDFEDSASLEELKAMVEFHLERVAPVLDLKILRVPGDEVANRDAPQGGAGNGTAADRLR
jgi:hypothetical protein